MKTEQLRDHDLPDLVDDASPAVIRLAREDDLAAVVAIDAAASGRQRPRYYDLMLQRALKEPALQVSLVAEVEGTVAGFLLASLYYGEYGVAEPSASIDAVGVAPGHRGRGVGRALVRQLLQNLAGLRIETIRTEVAWDDFDLLGFFRHHGFAPSGRMSLERRIDPTKD